MWNILIKTLPAKTYCFCSMNTCNQEGRLLLMLVLRFKKGSFPCGGGWLYFIQRGIGFHFAMITITRSIPTFTTGFNQRKVFRKIFILIKLAGEFELQRRKKKYIKYFDIFSKTPRKSWIPNRFKFLLCISFLRSVL